MSDNIIPFDPEATAPTRQDTAVDAMCDQAYTQAGTIGDRLSAVIDQMTHVNQALCQLRDECAAGGLSAGEIDQHLSDIALIESLVESFESTLYE